MTDLLAYPEVQSVIIPFAAALAAGWILSRAGAVWIGVGLVVGFLATALLVNGIQFQPLTAARKIILLGLGAGLLGAAIDAHLLQWRARAVFYLSALSILAALWVMGIALMRRGGSTSILDAAGIIAYTAWMTVTFDKLRADVLRASSAAVALGVGTGLAAIAGSSALFGQLGLALGAGAGACLVLAVISKQETAGAVLTFPAGILFALIGCASVMFAQLAWITLVILGVIPLAARWMPILPSWSRVARAAVLLSVTLIVSTLAFGYAWFLSGEKPYS